MHKPLTADSVTMRLIGATDAPRILAGEWKQLWLEKTGRVDREDLGDVLRVQMGKWTEPFNRFWYTKQTGWPIEPGPAIVAHPDYYWMTASPDGYALDPEAGRVIFQAKHTAQATSPSDLLERYLPQLTHEMMCSGVLLADLSSFHGNAFWMRQRVAFDFAFAGQLKRLEEEFWHFVSSDIEPGDREDLKPKAPPAVVVTSVEIDMTLGNQRTQWFELGSLWLGSRATVKQAKTIEKALKEMVADGVTRAFGDGIDIKRDRTGKLSIRSNADARGERPVADDPIPQPGGAGGVRANAASRRPRKPRARAPG